MKLRYTETALAEIDEIIASIEKDNVTAAAHVSAAIQAAVRRLSEFPLLAIETDVPGVRVLPVLPYRYVIFYNTGDDAIVVRNVRHTSRLRRFGAVAPDRDLESL